MGVSERNAMGEASPWVSRSGHSTPPPPPSPSTFFILLISSPLLLHLWFPVTPCGFWTPLLHLWEAESDFWARGSRIWYFFPVRTLDNGGGSVVTAPPIAQEFLFYVLIFFFLKFFVGGFFGLRFWAGCFVLLVLVACFGSVVLV